MTTLTISLPESMREFIDKEVDDGGFGTASEYVRSLLRNDQKRKAESRLETMLLEGLASERSPMTSNDWAALRESIRQKRTNRLAG